MNFASIRTALIAAAIVTLGAFVLLSIGGATAQSGCTQPISSDGDYSGSWTSGCLSENTPTGPTSPPSGTRYARFYTLTLSEDADIAIDLTSTTDPYLYLMQGTGTNGNVLYENDDVVSGNTNSRISENLSAGDYTIEATTYDLETTGDFTLTIQGLPDALTPTVTPTLAPGDTATVTPTPTFTPSPTPTQPSIPADVLNRLTALETAAATQQGLISTLDSKITVLDSRVAALEADASSPTTTPTPEPTPGPPTSASCSDFSPNANLRGCNLAGKDLSRVNLSGASLTDATLVNANLSDSVLTGADFEGADLSGADLSGADARHASFKDAILDKVRVVEAQFRSGTDDDDAMFRGTKLTNVVFDSGLKLTEVGFINADLTNTSFAGVDLQHADLRNATVTNTDFSGADLRNARLRSLKLNQATIDSKTNFEEADLTKADLSGMDLSGVDFEATDLEGADLSDGTFEDGRWDEVKLEGANLSGAEFIDVDFDEADFKDADLDDVDFEDCDLEGALNMRDADNIHDVKWDNTTCPDGSNSDDNPKDSCYPNNLDPS